MVTGQVEPSRELIRNVKDMTPRVRNALLKMGLRMLGDAAKVSVHELIKQAHLGVLSVAEIVDNLRRLGVTDAEGLKRPDPAHERAGRAVS